MSMIVSTRPKSATVAIRCRRMPRSPRWVYPRGLIDPPGDIPDPRRPLQLYERGIWDPADQYWGEPDGMLEISLVEVIAAGPRMQFEFEQLLPGGEDPFQRSLSLRRAAQEMRLS
jgi:hypothetical protein